MQTPLKKIQRHKHHFQLLELMVAAFILLICVAPTMRIFTSMYQAQQVIIRDNQRDHLVHLIHATFTEQLYKRTITLEGVKKGQPIVLEDYELEKLLKDFGYDFTGTFTLLKSSTPKGQEKPSMYLGQIQIKIKDTLHKPKPQEGNKKIEIEDPSDTYYDYYVYIDCGERCNEKEKSGGKANPANSQGQNASIDSGSSAEKTNSFDKAEAGNKKENPP